MAPRFYLLHGPDEFAQAEYLTGIKEKMGDAGLASLNTTVLDGRLASVSALRPICATLPFLTPRRLVIVEGWLTKLLSRVEADEDEDDAGEARRSGAAAKEVQAELVEYLPDLPATTALVFVEKRLLPDRNPVLSAARGAEWALVKLFDLPRDDALVRWIRARAKAEGGEISREAAEALAEMDVDPRGLGHEVAKLVTYVNAARPVALDDVEALTPAGGAAIIFDLVDAIGQRRGPVALRELHKMLETAEPLYVLSMIVRQYRLLLQVREMLDERASEAEISRALGMKPYPTEKMLAQARHFTLPDLERIYRSLLDYDADIKTGQMEAATALDVLVGALTA